jgi:nitrate reductase NapAB chaperone NapD
MGALAIYGRYIYVGSYCKEVDRSESACKQKMRKILDCGIYGEEKEGELIVLCIVSTSRSIASSVVCYAP